MPDATRVLSCLPQATLLALSQLLGFKRWHVLNKGEIVERLAGDGAIPLGNLRATLKISSLATICQDLRPDTRGSKKDLVGRILGEGKPPPHGDDPETPGKVRPESVPGQVRPGLHACV